MMHQDVGQAIADEYMKPCEICGHNTPSDTGRCSNCWQVEHRLEEYLTHAAGRANAFALMIKILEVT